MPGRCTGGADGSQAGSAKKKQELFIAIQQHLDKTFLQDHTLKGIAKFFGINEFLLKKGFKETTGATVFDYLISKRLDYSLQLLQTTDQSISEIGTTIGYKYPNHFSAAFKRKFGGSPSDWR